MESAAVPGDCNLFIIIIIIIAYIILYSIVADMMAIIIIQYGLPENMRKNYGDRL